MFEQYIKSIADLTKELHRITHDIKYIKLNAQAYINPEERLDALYKQKNILLQESARRNALRQK
jgi:hypothetical protein